jgi:hypothetical protein
MNIKDHSLHGNLLRFDGRVDGCLLKRLQVFVKLSLNFSHSITSCSLSGHEIFGTTVCQDHNITGTVCQGSDGSHSTVCQEPKLPKIMASTGNSFPQ